MRAETRTHPEAETQIARMLSHKHSSRCIPCNANYSHDAPTMNCFYCGRFTTQDVKA